MDIYHNFVKKNIFLMYSLPPRRPLIQGEPSNCVQLDVSYDQFYHAYLQLMHCRQPLNVNIYDGRSREEITNQDYLIRRNLMIALNQMSIFQIDFDLSDDMIKEYSSLLNTISWRHGDCSIYNMSINRHPTSLEQRNLGLNSLRGQISIKEEDLLWQTDSTITQIKSPLFKSADTVIKLKRLAYDYYHYLAQHYDMNKANDFVKTWLAYQYVHNHIAFANDATEWQDGRQRLKFNHDLGVSRPYQTFLNKKGVCEGQARLLKSLLNNPWMGVNAAVIGGKCSFADHAWVGVEINHNLYECCTTMGGAFNDMEKRQYQPDVTDIYSHIYPHKCLSQAEKEQLNQYTLSLKK